MSVDPAMAEIELRSLKLRIAALEGAIFRNRVAKTGITPAPVRFIASRAAELWSVPVRDILGDSREIQIVEPRFAVAWVAHRVTGYGAPRIGRAMGGRDNTTIRNACKRAGEWRETNASFRALTDRLLAECDQVLNG